MIVCYIAAPLRPIGAETIRSNLDRAKAWLRWLQIAYLDRAFLAPWILSVELGDDDSDPARRAAAIRRDRAIAARCDEIWIVGGRLSEGMAREVEACRAAGGTLRDDHAYDELPPSSRGRAIRDDARAGEE